MYLLHGLATVFIQKRLLYDLFLSGVPETLVPANLKSLFLSPAGLVSQLCQLGVCLPPLPFHLSIKQEEEQ